MRSARGQARLDGQIEKISFTVARLDPARHSACLVDCRLNLKPCMKHLLFRDWRGVFSCLLVIAWLLGGWTSSARFIASLTSYDGNARSLVRRACRGGWVQILRDAMPSPQSSPPSFPPDAPAFALGLRIMPNTGSGQMETAQPISFRSAFRSCSGASAVITDPMIRAMGLYGVRARRR